MICLPCRRPHQAAECDEARRLVLLPLDVTERKCGQLCDCQHAPRQATS